MHEPSNPQTEMKFAIDERLFYYKNTWSIAFWHT